MPGNGEEEDRTRLPAERFVRPEAIVFDLFHTLIDVNMAPGVAASRILGIDPVVWSRKLMLESPHHALGTVKDPYESVRRIVHSIDPAIPEEKIRAVVAARPNRFHHALVHVRPEVLSGLARLRVLGLKLGLLSNAALDEIEAWEESPLKGALDAALFSCYEGLMKPDPRFYHLAARRLGVPSSRCWFVGDGGSNEHVGARLAGMKTVLILGMLQESFPEMAAQRPRDTDLVITTMGDLVELVESAGESIDPTVG
jgi:putative hydrolase of the HAD superfamily